MSNWHDLDYWLHKTRPKSFMVYELCDALAIETKDGSKMIQDYQRAQERGETRFTIRREGPSSRSEWYVEAAK